VAPIRSARLGIKHDVNKIPVIVDGSLPGVSIIEPNKGNLGMKKLLLALAAIMALAAPAFAGTTTLNVTLPQPTPKAGIAAGTSVIPVSGVFIIAYGNRIDVYNPATNALIPSLTVSNLPIYPILDMAFSSPYLVVQGGPGNSAGYAVTIDFSTSPPVMKPYFQL
jgi:hypothetical protein